MAGQQVPMNHDLERSDLPTVLGELRLVSDAARTAFGHLSAAQIGWKPAETEWSVGQCLEHLVLSNEPYLPLLEEIARGRRKARAIERVPVLPGLWGRMLIRSLRPDSGRRLQARKAFRPTERAVDPGVVTRFLAEQDRLLDLMQATARLDLERIVITSPVLRLITYSLMDAYRIIAVHEQNHLVQARNVLLSEGFPGG